MTRFLPLFNLIFRGAAKGGSTRSMDPPVLIVVGPGRSSSDFAGSDSYFLGSDSYFLGLRILFLGSDSYFLGSE